MPHNRICFSPDHDACGVGFIAQLASTGSHRVVQQALIALCRLTHRGGVDADGRSGDGAGLLTAIPEKLIRKSARQLGIELPRVFGLGMLFVPAKDESGCCFLIENTAYDCGLKCLGWRQVPTVPATLGPRSLESLPGIRQCFFASDDERDLEARLFRLRNQLQVAASGLYFCSLSCRTVVYKGLLTPDQLSVFYPDLADPDFESSFAIFHQRYSTNTQPSWSLAQPFRLVAHNGEINTVNGNRRWFRARESSYMRGLGLAGEHSLLEGGMSDSASFDNALESLVRLGNDLPDAVSRLIPPAWENDERMDAALRSWFEQNALEQEPWDGPAAMVFSDGQTVGAKLDRNGLRPLRYTLTSDGQLVVGSEVGITDLRGKQVIERGRLGPGDMLLVDPAKGTLLRPPDIAAEMRSSRTGEARTRTVIFPAEPKVPVEPFEASRALAGYGWTEDQYRMLFLPMVEQGQEALWSMGDDTPPAAVSGLPRPLWEYCKQRFAQVTNPPIDPLRESHVMTLKVYLDPSIQIPSPVVDKDQVERLEARFGSVQHIDFTFPAEIGLPGAKHTLELVRQQAYLAAAKGAGVVVLTDRAISAERAALPALLAASAAWKEMVEAKGWSIPLIIESGQVVDSHHLALLVATGASAVHPYLAFQMAVQKQQGAARYRAALENGLRKVLARMGISAVASYRNSQLFETIGLDVEVCNEFFEDAARTIGGRSLDNLLADCLAFHEAGFGSSGTQFRDLGLYRFRHKGEHHANSPDLIRRLHTYMRVPTEENHKALAMLANGRHPVALRDMLEIASGERISIDEVESEASVLSRFSTQAMSLGAISPETHRTLAVTMNRLGGRSNTGEGGEDPEIYTTDPEANNRVKQVASGRFGVTTEYLVYADEIEIKMAQGSKPGEGGQLPAIKVTPYIARLRHAVPGTSLISPPPHHDIYSIEDLAQLIYDLRAVNPRARIGVKLVSSSGVGIIAVGVAKAGADIITISGHDGGTGASPLTSIKNTGVPWEIGIRETHVALLRAGLRARVRLRVDGGLKFARDVVIAALLGAEEFGFATAALLAVGCVMARQCHLNTCPAGIATQNEELRARFRGDPATAERYFRALARDVRELLASMGVFSIDAVVGAVHRLQPRSEGACRALRWLLTPMGSAPFQFPFLHEDPSELRIALNGVLEELESFSTRPHRFRITNSERAIGAHFSGELLRRLGASTCPVRPVDCEFAGTAGQSFGAFLVSGLKFRLTGEANDYVGKGLCGGSIAISAGAEASERGDVLVGNTVLYGATAGELYVAGQSGERFAIRNSGAVAVVEGVGQHGCEYMTAGIVLILGPVGINFGAGMTGGLAYLLCEQSHADGQSGSVRAVALEPQEERWLRRIMRRHLQLTGSPRTARLLCSAELPMLRIEPLNPPCSAEETWAPILARLPGLEVQALEPAGTLPADPPFVM